MQVGPRRTGDARAILHAKSEKVEKSKMGARAMVYREQMFKVEKTK